jgi:hypothetical protein
MTYLQALGITKPHFIQLIKSMNEDSLNILRIEFEANMNLQNVPYYNTKFEGDCNLFKGVLISKLLYMRSLV